MSFRKNKKILGIIGGMGPLATIEFQRQILDYTPAKKDQDHVPVIIHNNPGIPDRTSSLLKDDGKRFANEIVSIGNKLIKNGATVLCMPCVTAHSRFSEIQKKLSVPLINMIKLTVDTIIKDTISEPILILATDGTVKERIFEKEFLNHNISFALPNKKMQKILMKIIYRIKAGETPTTTLFRDFKNVKSVLLGCTELESYHEYFEKSGIKVINPLRILAKHVVEI